MRYDYDLVAVGGGVAGMVAAGVASSFGARSLLVDSGRLGGECAWAGCIPSKTLIHFANALQAVRSGSREGVFDPVPSVGFPKLMARVRGASETIYEEAAHPRHMERLGVECARAVARFLDPHVLELTDDDGGVKKVTTRFVVIATGARPYVPEIPGLSQMEYLTNQSVFQRDSQPDRLLVIGAGRVGLELGQAFHRLGTKVVIVDHASGILPGDDPEHAGLLLGWLKEEGLDIRMETVVDEARTATSGEKRFSCRSGSEPFELASDAVLVAAGHRPLVSGLNLEAAGVAFDARGIQVDSGCRTTQRNIFAAGDVVGRLPFTHFAEHMAKTAVMNAVFRVPIPCDEKHATWCTFTDPEIGQLGPTEQELKRKGVQYELHRLPYSMIDRAVTEEATRGAIKVMATKWRGKILGVSILGRFAGEMLCEWALAMRNGLRLRHMADTIHPYPTYGFGNRRAADQYYIRRRPLGALRLLKRILGFQGPIVDVGKDGTPV